MDIINSIYDSPIAYSLRDKDEIEDIPPLRRYRLKCRVAENLILCDEVLTFLSLDWETMINRLDSWLDNLKEHPKYNKMQEFKDSDYDRLTFKLKEIRNIIIGETGTEKPWGVAVGQVIGKLVNGEIPKDFSENNLAAYLGEKLVNELIK